MIAYLVRHWRGELPLGVAWWVNVVALTAASLALDAYGPALGLAPAIETRAAFTALLAGGLAVLLLLPAWQLVGVFRAADRHAAEVGTILAARATQSVATLLTVLLAIRFMVFAGEAWSGARIAYPFGPANVVALSHAGRVLEVRGPIRFGLAAQVADALAAAPAVRRLRLTSGGGSLSEARRIRELVLARGLDTDAVSLCSSACVSAYVGGRHRLLRRSARLGFHLPRNPGFGLRGPVTADYAAELAYFGSRGVPPWFRQRWVGTGRAFWYPAPAQLRAAGVVHAFVGAPRPGEEFYFAARTAPRGGRAP
jgi:hypothetical protein